MGAGLSEALEVDVPVTDWTKWHLSQRIKVHYGDGAGSSLLCHGSLSIALISPGGGNENTTTRQLKEQLERSSVGSKDRVFGRRPTGLNKMTDESLESLDESVGLPAALGRRFPMNFSSYQCSSSCLYVSVTSGYQITLQERKLF